MTSPETEKANLTVCIPTLGRPSLQRAKESCGNLPVEVQKDTHRKGAGPSRNLAIQRAKTDWVSFLDDDDEYTSDFPDRFQEALEQNPDADVIIFRMQYPDGRVLPKVPKVIWSNVGISFACKTTLARKHPFIRGADAFNENEDFKPLKTFEENGAKIVFSPHIVYRVKPSGEAQANARINNL